jgi:hypothetical protein
MVVWGGENRRSAIDFQFGYIGYIYGGETRLE